MSWTYPTGLVLLLLVVACAGERAPVERLENGTWQAESFQFISLTGQRDGTDVAFSVEFQGEGGRRLLMRGTVAVDPGARFTGGDWLEEGGGQARSGLVTSGVVDFLGGQGGRPSLGGQFTLSEGQAPLYRVNVKTSELQFP